MTPLQVELRWYLDGLWYWTQGLTYETVKTLDSMEELQQTQWSKEFEQLMRNRLVIGSLRYGKMLANGKPQYDRIASARRHLEQYEESGNLEHLVDVANTCLIEFLEGNHPNRHFCGIDDGEHAKIKK